MVIKLSREEKRIIRKIARIQLNSLSNILNGDTETDIPMHCIEYEIEQEHLMKAVENDIRVYEEMMFKPGQFFNQQRYNMKISTHILMRYFKKEKYEESRRSIFRKICLLEELKISLN